MITKIKLYIYGALAAGFAIVLTLVYGKGRKDAETKYVRRRLDAIKEKQDVKREVETSDDQRLIDLISRDN